MKETATTKQQNSGQRSTIIRSHSWSTIKARLKPPVPWVALLGVDGSGKSSVLRLLEHEIATTPFAGLVVIHRRPKMAYPETNSQPDVFTHYRKPPYGPVKSIVKLMAIVLDWQLGYWRHVTQQRARKRLVICDRHALLDLLVDPLRYRYGASSRLARLALDLVPMPDAVLLLDAPPDVLRARKQELTMAQIVTLRNAYLQLVQELNNGYVIDASKSLEQVVAQVRHIVLGVNWTDTS